MSVIPLSVIILTYNEEVNIKKCIKSLYGWVDEIFIVDSGSTDRTPEIVKSFGAILVFHEFETHTKQWQWALNNLPIKNEWLLCLDADQRISYELRDELIEVFCKQKKRLAKVDGFYIKRRQIFRGKWIRYGGYYPRYLLKLFRKGKVILDEHDFMDHHFYVPSHTEKLKNDLIEENIKEDNIDFWLQKHINYATLHAKEEIIRRKEQRHPQGIKPSLFGTPDQQILFLKRIWYKLPLYIRPCLYFIYRYIIKLGFLDGKEGFIFHFLQSFWYRLIVDIKLEDLMKNDKTSSKAE